PSQRATGPRSSTAPTIASTGPGKVTAFQRYPRLSDSGVCSTNLGSNNGSSGTCEPGTYASAGACDTTLVGVTGILLAMREGPRLWLRRLRLLVFTGHYSILWSCHGKGLTFFSGLERISLNHVVHYEAYQLIPVLVSVRRVLI